MGENIIKLEKKSLKYNCGKNQELDYSFVVFY